MAKPAFKTTDTGDRLMAADTIGLGVERCFGEMQLSE